MHTRGNICTSCEIAVCVVKPGGSGVLPAFCLVVLLAEQRKSALVITQTIHKLEVEEWAS